jgi:hypothetical protein
MLYNKGLSRRNFLAGAGAAGAAAGLAGCADNGALVIPQTSTAATYTDLDVLNFALNLEYLEAQFYLYAATGKGLATADTVAPSGYTGKYTLGTVTVGSAAMVAGASTAQMDIINEIAYEEQNHVRFLRAALGANAVPMPSLDLSFFGPLAVAASIFTSSQPAFNPFANFNAFLVGAFIFEDVGVTAYAGAAPLISAAGVASGYLTAAAGILAVEAYHAAYIRTALTGSAIAAGATNPTPSVPFPTAYPYIGYADYVANLRAALTVGDSGAPIVPTPAGTSTGNTGAAGSSSSVEVTLTVPQSLTSASSIVACDSATAIGFARTVNQVHHIVYGSPTVGVAKGGFFPNGTNSIFATTTA